MLRPLVPLLAAVALLVLASTAAAGQDATPATAPPAGVSTETLLAVTFPADTVPTGEATVDFFRLDYEPGTTLEFPSTAPSRSVLAELVVDGMLGARSEGAMRVVRADGATEEVPPGTEATLGPGDAAIYLDNSAPQVLRNAGEGPLVTINVGIFSTVEPATPVPPNVFAGTTGLGLGYLDPAGWERAGLTGMPLAVTLRRVTLEPGASLPPSAETVPTLRAVETGELAWEVLRPEGTPTASRAVIFRPDQSVSWTPLRRGRVLVLRNEGDGPVTYLELTIAAAEPKDAPSRIGTPGA
jgi:hypothetical protein